MERFPPGRAVGAIADLQVKITNWLGREAIFAVHEE